MSMRIPKKREKISDSTLPELFYKESNEKIYLFI